MNPAKNILYIYVDSLRKDFISFYGWDFNTPNIDRLGERSTVLKNLITVPSTHESLSQQLTGLYSYRKKWKNLGDSKTLFDFFPEHKKFIVSLQKPFGTGVNNSDYKTRFGDQPETSFGDMVKTLSWHKRDSFIGFFGFWTLRDPAGYQPKNLEEAITDYKERMGLLDEYVGILSSKFKEYDLYKNTIVVFVADHGEYFSGFERKYTGTFVKGHNHSRYEEVINLPCMICIPGLDCRFFDCTLETVDLTPTLLSLCNIKYDSSQFDGSDFSAEIKGNISTHKKYIIIGCTANANYQTVRSTEDGYKLLLDEIGGYSLLNFKEDPTEEINYTSTKKNIVESLKKIAESNKTPDIFFTKDDYIDRFVGYKNIEYVNQVFEQSGVEDNFKNRKNYSTGDWVNDKNSVDEIFNFSGLCGGKLLDLGCGNGIVAKAGCDKGFEAYATDISPHMLLGINDQRIKIIFGRAEKIPFESGFFKLVAARGLFQYVENIDKSFNETKRILQSGGVFVIFNTTPPNDECFEEWSQLHKDCGSTRILRKAEEYHSKLNQYFSNVSSKVIKIKQRISSWANSNNLEKSSILKLHRGLSENYKKSCNFIDSLDDISIDLSFLLLKAYK